MLTLLDAISLAGSRAKQNDDIWGLTRRRAFVIDGATDLHDAPIADQRTDACWISRAAAAQVIAADADSDARDVIAGASQAIEQAWAGFPGAAGAPVWKHPIAALLMATETGEGVEIADLGDCRAFVSDASGARMLGGKSKDDESAHAASFGAVAGESVDLRPGEVVEHLRAQRAETVASAMVFGIDPACAANARVQAVALAWPAYVLLATDGFSSLVDVYAAHTPESLMAEAHTSGLAALAMQLRAIEATDPSGGAFPRWKTSDDATAVLLRLE